MSNLRKQFEQALTNIEVNGQKRKRAIEAHTEIRELLQQDEQLKEWGVEPLLIGSYGRGTGIYPGKDVDVLLRFTKLDTRAEPRAVFHCCLAGDRPEIRAVWARRRTGTAADPELQGPVP